MARKKPAAAATTKTAHKEEIFAAAYVAHSNATRAAETAGYSKATAYAKGCELLARPRVKAMIDAARSRITKKFNVNAERVIEEMAVIGFSNVAHYRMADDGYIELAAEAPDSAIRAIKRIKRKLRLIPQSVSTSNPEAKPIREIETEFELWNKDGELRNLGEYLAIFKENRRLDDEADDDLTPEQRKDRIIQLLRVAAGRRKHGKKAG